MITEKKVLYLGTVESKEESAQRSLKISEVVFLTLPNCSVYGKNEGDIFLGPLLCIM